MKIALSPGQLFFAEVQSNMELHMPFSNTCPSLPSHSGGLPVIGAIPSHESDFLPEIHRIRMARNATTLFGEPMTEKTSNTADAKQKRKS